MATIKFKNKKEELEHYKKRYFECMQFLNHLRAAGADEYINKGKGQIRDFICEVGISDNDRETIKEIQNKPPKVWDDHNKQWLIITGLIFDQEGNIERIQANEEGEGKFGDPFYALQGDDLELVGLDINIAHNKTLIP